MSSKRITIKDISEELGVSVGTINKVLNNKSGVSNQTRERVLRAAEKMGYRVNKVAQSMARATITLGIVIPTEWQGYYSLIERGIREELDRLLDYNVEGVFYPIESTLTPTDTVAAIEKCIEDGVSGVILCDVIPTGLDGALDRLNGLNIPTVAIGCTDNAAGRYLCAVCPDAYKSGRSAAEMLELSCGKGAELIILVGNKDRAEHAEKLRGFTDYARETDMSVVGAYETQDDEDIAEKLLYAIASGKRTPDGIYLATCGALSLCRLRSELGMPVRIVGTDVTEESAEELRRGSLQCIMFQSPKKQGAIAVRVLYEYLSERQTPERIIRIEPSVVIKSNLGAFVD